VGKDNESNAGLHPAMMLGASRALKEFRLEIKTNIRHGDWFAKGKTRFSGQAANRRTLRRQTQAGNAFTELEL